MTFQFGKSSKLKLSRKTKGVFRFKKGRKLAVEVPAIKIKRAEDELTGLVHGETATDIEERMYIAFLHNGIRDDDIEFQPSYITGRRLPGEIRPDFATYQAVLTMIWYADEDYFHRSAEQRTKDETNDAILLERLEGSIEPPIRISGDELATQESADRAIAEYV